MYDPGGKTAFRAFKKVWFEQSTPCPPSLSHPCYHTSACTALWDAGLTSASVSSAYSLPLLVNDYSNWFRRAERASANWSVAAAAPFLVSPQIFSQFTSNIAMHFYKLCKYEGEVGRTSSDGWLKSALLWKVLQFLLSARHWGEVAFFLQCSWKTRTKQHHLFAFVDLQFISTTCNLVLIFCKTKILLLSCKIVAEWFVLPLVEHSGNTLQ